MRARGYWGIFLCVRMSLRVFVCVRPCLCVRVCSYVPMCARVCSCVHVDYQVQKITLLLHFLRGTGSGTVSYNDHGRVGRRASEDHQALQHYVNFCTANLLCNTAGCGGFKQLSKIVLRQSLRLFSTARSSCSEVLWKNICGQVVQHCN